MTHNEERLQATCMLKATVKATLRAVLPEPALFRLSAYNHYFCGERELRLLRWMCDRDRTALDIGANVGSFTYFLRKHSRHVYAYEPIPDLAARLARLCPDVTVRCAAVSDKRGTLTLRVPIFAGRLTHELASVSIDYRRWTEVQEYNVPTLCLDDEDTGSIGFIKIDVEQHEIAVLHGAIKQIYNCRPAILAEINPFIYPDDLPDMFEFITDNSYRGFFKFRGRYLPFAQFSSQIHADKRNFGQGDFVENTAIFLPEEKDASFFLKHNLAG